MKTIKLTTPWNHDHIGQTPGASGIVGNYKFEIDNECDSCDFWIAWGGRLKKDRVHVPPDNVIYLTDEAHSERLFHPRFIDQFSRIITSRTDINPQKVLKTHYLGIWHFKRNYDEVASMEPPVKKKNFLWWPLIL